MKTMCLLSYNLVAVEWCHKTVPSSIASEEGLMRALNVKCLPILDFFMKNRSENFLTKKFFDHAKTSSPKVDEWMQQKKSELQNAGDLHTL
jgi:hypothetical protein